LENELTKKGTHAMITKRQIKELLEEAKAEARTAHDTKYRQGKAPCDFNFNSGYYEGQKDLLEMLLKVKKVKYIIN
jgi:hypothetical protein